MAMVGYIHGYIRINKVINQFALKKQLQMYRTAEQFEILCTVFYPHSAVTMTVSSAVSEITSV